MSSGGPSCIECGAIASLVRGDRIYPHLPQHHDKPYWLCRCGAYCGCHPNTEKPLGYPAGPETRQARNVAHRVFDPIWKEKRLRRGSAYAWMQREMKISKHEAHIGMFSADQARKLVRLVREHFG